MGKPLVVMSAQCQCSMGMAPGVLSVIPTAPVLIDGKPLATITNAKPFAEITPFGMCKSPANPAVAAATVAALGILTPMPCTPMPTSWIPSGPPLLGGQPVLTKSCQAICAFGGQISISAPGCKVTA